MYCWIQPLLAVLITSGLPFVVPSASAGCQTDRDEFGLIWNATEANETRDMLCPGGTGYATRHCDKSSIWKESNVTDCRSHQYTSVVKQTQNLSALPSEEAENVSVEVAKHLVEITKPSVDSATFPRDISASVTVLNDVIRTNSISTTREDGLITNVFLVHNNLLSASNIPGWIQLSTFDPAQCELFLLNAENFSVQIAHTLNILESKTLPGENIVIAAEAMDADDISTVTWPDQEDFKNHSSPVAVTIPKHFIEHMKPSDINAGKIYVAHTVFHNFALPSVNIDDGSKATPVSLILSSKVDMAGTGPIQSTSSDDLVVLRFDYSLTLKQFIKKDYGNLRCGFWDADLDQGSFLPLGGWSSDGLHVDRKTKQTVTCNSTHLTSFAVLVDVSGASQKISKEHKMALSLVSYVGCAISIICLIAAVLLFVIYRDALLKDTHNFIHCNLTIALLLALTVFVTGIELATEHKTACKVVAALLHYFFTAVFTWMLCEGIMLYFLLVKVLNIGVGLRKRLYFVFAWGAPFLIVAIAFGVAFDQYGTDDYCWISTDKGAIWAIVGPVLIIIMINVVFLVLALYIFCQRKQVMLNSTNTSNAELKLVKTTVKATIILLPLLGTTWIFGILVINKESIVFAWIFTIVNSLQGAFIFAFHLLRNKQIMDNLKSSFKNRFSKFSTPMSQDRTFSTSSSSSSKKFLEKRGDINSNDFTDTIRNGKEMLADDSCSN
ncbi:latrophilin-like protein LAT-2 [Dysidea avara]|uniref:latrophilin-like protein LAT-2 n=1 Tax=Dysidea avara TaxID=196820 RepID=UPI00332F3BA4